MRKIQSGFGLRRQSREHATVGKTHVSISVEGYALPSHPLTLKWLHTPPAHTTSTTTTTTTTNPVFPSSPVSSTVYEDEV